MFKNMITKNMKRKHMKLLATITLAIMLLGILATTVFAQAGAELFEAQSYYTYYGPKDGVFSLTYVGRGCPAVGDQNDYRFRINVSYSSIYTDWKFYSNNSSYSQLPTGRLFNGYGFNTTEPYVCIGSQEFTWLPWRWNYWTIAGVQQNIYVWRK